MVLQSEAMTAAVIEVGAATGGIAPEVERITASGFEQ
jgi:hypothetical protein